MTKLPRVKEYEVTDRVMPQSPEIEQEILGAIMLDPDKFTRISEVIKPECFYLDQHRFIFQAMVELKQRGLQPDLPSVIDDLRTHEILEKCGGAGYLASLLGSVSTSAHAEFHAELVAEKFVMRQLIKTCTDVVEETYKQDMTAPELLDFAEKAIMDVTRFGRSIEYYPVADVVKGLLNQVMETYDYRKENPHEEFYAGVPSGFGELDKLLGGFHEGSLNILAARPGIGKTSLALNAATHIARTNKKKYPVLMFSLEMPNHMLALRLLSSEAHVSIGGIERAELDDEGWSKFGSAIRSLSATNILMNDASSLTVRQIAGTARRVLSKFEGIALIVVDYLQLMRADGKFENRVNEVSAISRSLKTLALELRVPILACSQLSRAIETRDEQKPKLSDLRESGSIEQDADVVLFLYPYVPPEDTDSGPANKPEYKERVKKAKGNLSDKIWCTVSKNRNGPQGDCPMIFLREFCKFTPGKWADFPTSYAGPEFKSGTRYTKRKGTKE